MNLKAILNRDPEKISGQRAERLLSAGLRKSNTIVEDLRRQRESLVEQIDDLLDLSPRTDINAGITKLSNKEIESIVEKYHNRRDELHLLDQRIKVAILVNAELSGEDKALAADVLVTG